MISQLCLHDSILTHDGGLRPWSLEVQGGVDGGISFVSGLDGVRARCPVQSRERAVEEDGTAASFSDFARREVDGEPLAERVRGADGDAPSNPFT